MIGELARPTRLEERGRAQFTGRPWCTLVTTVSAPQGGQPEIIRCGASLAEQTLLKTSCVVAKCAMRSRGSRSHERFVVFFRQFLVQHGADRCRWRHIDNAMSRKFNLWL